VLCVADAVMATVLDVVGIVVVPSELLPFAELDDVMSLRDEVMVVVALSDEVSEMLGDAEVAGEGSNTITMSAPGERTSFLSP
jgi:hypothetical protein